MNTSPLVSVIVLNYNGKKFVQPLFDSLFRTTYPSVEWIVVDNASSDDSADIIEKQYRNVQLIRSNVNLGYTGGNNLGIKAARGKYLVLLNNDVEVAPNWLDHLVKEAENDERIGALQPKLQSMINRGYFEYAGAAGGFIDRWGFAFLRGRMFDTIEFDRGQYDEVREIFWASGAALFLRRSAADEVGLLDETFFMHYEEIDLCWRLHLHGYKVKSIPQSVVLHYVSASLPAANFRKLYWNHRNSLILLIKNLSGHRFFLTLVQRYILDGAAGIHALFQLEPKRIFAILKAHFWIYTHILPLMRKRKIVQQNRKVPEDRFRHLIYPRSIVVDYFLKKKKEFHTLIF
jgi:hypothetical protein